MSLSFVVFGKWFSLGFASTEFLFGLRAERNELCHAKMYITRAWDIAHEYGAHLHSDGLLYVVPAHGSYACMLCICLSS